MSGFMDALQGTMEDLSNRSVTENGALGYRTTGNDLLDLNFSLSSYRDEKSEMVILLAFDKVWNENPNLAVKWLFFSRDIRGGLGERRFFRIVFKSLVNMISRDDAVRLIKLIPEFGRWDDMFIFFGTDYEQEILEIIQYQIREDVYNKHQGNSISLLAKWLPSINTSSAESRRRAKVIAKFMGYDDRMYRKTLSMLRGYIDVVEKKMSSNDWDHINYPAVPSKANLLYSKSFMKHDEERRQKFLIDLESGETKINSSALYPYEILQKMKNAMTYTADEDEIRLCIKMWESLPNTVTSPEQSAIVVCDGSSSMDQYVSNTSVSVEIIAQALALYFAEKLHGEFKDKVITFSEHPKYLDFSKCKNISEKFSMMRRYREVANTNIEAVFKLILTTAVKYEMDQEDIPGNIIIISDMEFDSCAESDNGVLLCDPDANTLFGKIGDMFSEYGYSLPRLVFWNLASRTKTIPMKSNPLGVCLVSGFSTNIADMVMSGETDPVKNLINKLMTDRYKDVYVTSKYERAKEYVAEIHE